MVPNIDVARELSGELAPRLVPTSYPGWWPSESFIITGDDEPRLFYLRPPTFGLESLPRGGGHESFFRVGHRELTTPSSGTRGHSLANYLRSNGLDAMDARVPVLAVGSNASPSQLVYKFRNTGASASIPTIRISIEGFAVGFVPTVSKFGYIPSTFFPAPGMRANLFLQFFDRNQLDVMDESEGLAEKSAGHLASGTPNLKGYERVWIDAPISMDGGETLCGAYAYVGRRGLLALNGRTVLSDNAAFGGGFSRSGQSVIHEDPSDFPRVGSQDELVELLEAHDAALATDFRALLHGTRSTDDTAATARTSANKRLSSFVQENPLLVSGESSAAGGPTPSGVEGLRFYGRLSQELDVALGPDAQQRLGLFRVRPTLDNTERQGESVVVVNYDDFQKLGKPSHVSLHNRSVENFLRSGHELEFRAPRAIARCVPDPFGGTRGAPHADAIPSGCARVDELLRVACGLHLEEIVEIRVVSKNRSVVRRAWDGFVDALLRKPNYALCRVGLADVTTMEREVALVTPITLQMLGVDSGDYVVLEGVSQRVNADGSRSWSVSSTAARVFELDEQTLERRTAMQNGGWLSAYPKAEIALGLAQDLSPMFIDSALRTRLFGPQHGQKVGTVRVRASRPDQIRRELREFAIVVLFSLIIAILSGETGVFAFEVWQVWAFTAVLLATLGLLIVRVRSRYRHTRRSRKWNTPVARG